MISKKKIVQNLVYSILIALVSKSFLFSINVSNLTELNSAIDTANVNSTSTTITLTSDITDANNYVTPLCINSPSSSYSLLSNCNITINGGNHTLNQGSYRGFFIGGNPYNTSGSLANSSAVTLQNLTITGVAQGGNGAGRGAGFGGGLFVCTSTTVTLSDVTFTNCNAIGGNGASGDVGGVMGMSNINTDGQTVGDPDGGPSTDYASGGGGSNHGAGGDASGGGGGAGLGGGGYPSGGFGGGDVSGGGMGAGGAIFVHTGATLNVTSATFSGSSIAGGGGTNSGLSYGKDIFLVSGGNINFNLTSDLAIEVIGGNYSQAGFTATGSSGVTVNNNSGITLTMTTPAGQSSYNGLFDGVLKLNGGILSIDSDYGLGYSTVNPTFNGGILATTNSLTTSRNFTIGNSGATFQPSVATTLTINGTISNTGGLTKQGPGTLILTAANSYTGTTSITAGGLTLSGSGTLGNNSNLTMSGGTFTIATGAGAKSIGYLTGSGGSIALNDNTLTITQGADGTFAGTISGTGGGITKSGANTLTLTSVNSYTGTTTITAGGLTLSSSGTIGGATAPLSMSGGTLTLPTGLGARTIGGLSGSGGTIALNNNALTITQSSTGTFAGAFTGTTNSHITKEGSAVLTLSENSSSFLGSTTINAGTLAVNATLNGVTTVNSSGRLQGVGTLDDLNNFGTVSPGNSIGILNIGGDFTMASAAAILEIEIAHDGSADQMIITGNATLDGYVHLLPEPGTYVVGQEFLILTAGSITNQFSGIVESVRESFNFLKVGNEIYVVVNQTFIVSPFASLLTANAKLTYDYLFCPLTEDSNLIALQNTLLALPTVQALSDALVQLCPALYSALPLLELQNNVHMAQVMIQESRNYICNCYCECDETKNGFPLASFWLQPMGFYYNQKGVQGQFGFHDYTYGTAMGFLMPIYGKLAANVGLGYTHSNLKWNNNYGHSTSSSLYLTPSLNYFTDTLFLSFLVQGDLNFYKTKRNISFTGVQEQATNQHKSYNLLCGFDFSLKFEVPAGKQPRYTPISFEKTEDHFCYRADYMFYIQPEIQLFYMNFFQDSFTEQGAADLNLLVNRKRTVFLQPNVGVKLIQEINTYNCCFAPNIYLGYLTNIALSNPHYTSSMYQFDIPCSDNFYVNGFDRAANQVAIGVEFVMRHKRGILFTCGYNATLVSHFFTQGVNLRFSFEF